MVDPEGGDTTRMWQKNKDGQLGTEFLLAWGVRGRSVPSTRAPAMEACGQSGHGAEGVLPHVEPEEHPVAAVIGFWKRPPCREQVGSSHPSCRELLSEGGMYKDVSI